jgi:Tfp pilus assembly pilus retraction ATPase PilT
MNKIPKKVHDMVRLRLASSTLHAVLSQLLERVEGNAIVADSYITDDLATAIREAEKIRDAIDDIYGPQPAEDE